VPRYALVGEVTKILAVLDILDIFPFFPRRSVFFEASQRKRTSSTAAAYIFGTGGVPFLILEVQQSNSLDATAGTLAEHS